MTDPAPEHRLTSFQARDAARRAEAMHGITPPAPSPEALRNAPSQDASAMQNDSWLREHRWQKAVEPFDSEPPSLRWTSRLLFAGAVAAVLAALCLAVYCAGLVLKERL